MVGLGARGRRSGESSSRKGAGGTISFVSGGFKGQEKESKEDEEVIKVHWFLLGGWKIPEIYRDYYRKKKQEIKEKESILIITFKFGRQALVCFWSYVYVMI